jgi:predicted MPP superfamily phosphohydrolase
VRVLIFTAVILLIALLLGFGVIALLRFLNKEWWKNKIVKRVAFGLMVWGMLSIVIWITGYFTKKMWLYNFGSLSTVIVLTLSLSLILTLPFSGFFHWVNRKLDKRKQKSKETIKKPPDKNRRAILKGAAILFPLASITETTVGMASAFGKARVYMLPLEFENLPAGLEGLRILHLTDSHLGIYRNLNDIERVMTEAERFNPDLTVFTGDICDELKFLVDTLSLAASLNPRLGTYACLGNHEYYRGIDTVLRAFGNSNVPLLINKGVELSNNDQQIYLAGIDDPRVMGRDVSDFYAGSVSAALEEAPDDSFKILISHRPDSFDYAAEKGVKLTLSGHTHGGQVGINRKSFWSRFARESYLWGLYKKENSQMYVSSGIGHWFPFRLGCPAEAPVIELKSKV